MDVTDEFLHADNITILRGKIGTIYANNGMKRSMSNIHSRAVTWITIFETRPMPDNFVNQNEVIDYLNKEFVKFICGDIFSNPFRNTINGQLFNSLMPEDYGNLDYWEPNHTFSVIKQSNKAIHNPHVIGAHRRHYASTAEGLRQHEKGPMRVSGWDMSAFHNET